jgi:FKBP-type peptidyl-prolyl cis-trans isomerase SlyD
LAGPDGERFNGTVIEIKENAVTIDLNHPRAGQDLHFVGTVVENRVATNEEVTGMLNLLSGEGCGCGCGCGDCGGGCDSGDSCGCGHCH